jgi:hypothetical protein
MRWISLSPTPCRQVRRLAGRLVTSLLIAASTLLAIGEGPARAASTGSTNLLMPQGTGAEVQFGDFITSNFASTCTGCIAGAGLDTLYRFYIEVPAGLTRLRIQIFDPDIGAGDTGGGGIEGPAQRDRCRGVATCTTADYSTNVKYTLINPAGTTVATQTCNAGVGAGFCTDNAWSSILDITTGITAGHWELDVDQTTAVNAGAMSDTVAGDINAIGIRADDGDATSGGTEIPVYYLAQNQIGQNIPAGGGLGTKSYSFYPYVTSGCSFTENDFDFDLNNGGTGQNVGSINFTSRSASFTKNFASTSLSTNDNWKINSVSGYTSTSDATDYGIWTMAASISNYNNGGVNGNYANIYIANSSSAGGQPANNSPTANTFRVYFPADGGAAPVKPYMEQEARYVFLGGAGGPNPPAVGMTTINQITVQVVNPTAKAITFSATNLVTVNVPGPVANLTYGGNAAVTQGTIVSQPAVNGTGNITWNPGSVAAGTTALLTYQVNVKPTSAGQVIPVVGTVASGNGTKGVWVDETGNTTQARATLTFGPLCELSATAGVVSAAEVVDLRATAPTAHGRGVVVEWRTVAEIAAAGFDLYREDPATHEWHQVNRAIVPGLPGSPQGGNYRVIDEGAPTRSALPLHYMVVETETNGGNRHFPFRVALQDPDAREAAGTSPAADGTEATADAATDLDNSESAAGRTARRDPAWARRLAAAAAAAAETAPAGATPDLFPGGGSPSLEIGVRADGLYRIDPSVYLPALAANKTTSLLLTSQGLPVAYTLDATGGVLFYGQATTSNYSRDNVYWLRKGPAFVMGSASGGNPTTTGSPTAAFVTSQHTEQETFAATTTPADPDSDYWYWDFLIAGDPTYGTKSFGVAAPNAVSQAGSLTVHLGAATAGQNHVHVSLNGVPLGDTTWSGAVPQTATFAASGFNAGTNTVQLTSVLDPGVSSSIVYLQSLDAGYPRTFTAAGDALVFTGSGFTPVTVSGFSGPGIRLFDVTNPRSPAVVSGTLIDTVGGASRVTLKPTGPTTKYFAAGPAAVQPPAWVKPVANSFAALQPGGADYLILTTSDLLSAANSLAALRSAQGLRTAVVDVADVMNGFNFGLSSPHAIQAFLKFVRAFWNPQPRYVVLAGAGNFDYRNVLGLGGNLIPPLMTNIPDGLFAADNLYSAGKGDGVPDFAIGRLPVVSAAELQAYVAKVAAFEASAGSGWYSQALMLADQVGPNDGVTDFVADSNALASTLPAGYSPQLIAVAPGGVAAARAAMFGGLANGAGLMNYFGHAGLDELSPAGLLTTSDVPAMNNGPRLPLLTALTCNVNRFDVPGFSPLGQLLTLHPGGGAIAVWSSSGSSVHPEGKQLGQTFTYALANPANLRLGDVVQQALHRYAAIPGLQETLSLYTLLGDPAILLKPVPVVSTQGSTSTKRE